ncbi:MAG: histidine phosphatase family protein [bacterium]
MLPLRRLEIRRHAAKDATPGVDRLSPEGIRQAHDLGRSLRVGYTHLYSSGAQRATQTLACMIAGMGRHVLNGVVVRPELVSQREAEWRGAVESAGTSEVEALRSVAGSLVEEEAARLGAELREILSELPEGGYGLAIGHSPLIECAIYRLTAKPPVPLAACDGFLITELKGGRLDVERLRGNPPILREPR